MTEEHSQMAIKVDCDDQAPQQQYTLPAENIQESDTIRLDFTNLTYSIFSQTLLTRSQQQSSENQRTIIKDLTGSFTTGINAILGGSGAGKTTFLNLLAKKIDPSKSGQITGTVTANGYEFSGSSFKDFAGFVMQDDHLLATMTVRECLKFAADMKLAHLTETEKTKEVERILRILMLQNCQNTFIGDALNKGISGGERKRCSIGVELIGNPQMLFLDEPTSGLDSFTAFQIVSALRNYANEYNRTIIFTIHSPSSDIWNLFDTVTLLAEGHIIYSGTRDRVIHYFKDLGYECPRLSNPADYFICLLQQLPSDALDKLQVNQRQHNLKASTGTSKQHLLHVHSSAIKSTTAQNKRFGYVISKLIKRQVLNIKRNRILLRARIVQSVAMNVLTGLIYLGISKDTSDNANAFQIIKTTFLMGMGIIFQSMNPQVITFSIERAVILKEQDSGMYGSLEYFLSKIIPELVICSYFGLQVTAIMYFMIGFYATSHQFFFYVLVMVVMANVGNAIGIVASASFKDAKVALVCVNLFMIPILLFAGIFKNLNDMFDWISWIRFLSPTYYQVCSLAESQLEGSGFTLDYKNYLKLDFGMWGGVLMLVAYYFVANILAYFLLLTKRTKLQ